MKGIFYISMFFHNSNYNFKRTCQFFQCKIIILTGSHMVV